jgi:hypothetical protein
MGKLTLVEEKSVMNPASQFSPPSKPSPSTPLFQVWPCPIARGQGHVIYNTWGADKSLVQPGKKQATATEDLDSHISYL